MINIIIIIIIVYKEADSFNTARGLYDNEYVFSPVGYGAIQYNLHSIYM